MDDSAPADSSPSTTTPAGDTPSWKDLYTSAMGFVGQALAKKTDTPAPQVVTVQAPAPTLSDYLKKPEVMIGGGLVLVLVLVLALRH